MTLLEEIRIRSRIEAMQMKLSLGAVPKTKKRSARAARKAVRRG